LGGVALFAWALFVKACDRRRRSVRDLVWRLTLQNLAYLASPFGRTAVA
jgi:hypothetical protein